MFDNRADRSAIRADYSKGLAKLTSPGAGNERDNFGDRHGASPNGTDCNREGNFLA